MIKEVLTLTLGPQIPFEVPVNNIILISVIPDTAFSLVGYLMEHTVSSLHLIPSTPHYFYIRLV